MMEEEGMVIVGLLVGLNVLDANLCLKGEDLDSQVKLGLQMERLFQARDLTQGLPIVLNLRNGQRASNGGLGKVPCWAEGRAGDR